VRQTLTAFPREGEESGQGNASRDYPIKDKNNTKGLKREDDGNIGIMKAGPQDKIPSDSEGPDRRGKIGLNKTA